ncbi:hypothetical protein [Acidilobus sp.]
MSRTGHDVEYCMRPSLSYETTPLEDGIRRTVEWYLENQGW